MIGKETYEKISARVEEAQRSTTSRERLEELAVDREASVRAMVAGREDMGGELLAAMAAVDSAPAVLVAVGRNPSTPEDTVIALMLDAVRISGPVIRDVVAREEASPRLRLAALLADEYRSEHHSETNHVEFYEALNAILEEEASPESLRRGGR